MMRTTIPRKIYRKARNAPSELALWTINIASIENRLRALHDQAQRDHEASLPPLSPDDMAIVEGLKRDGVYMTSLASLALPLTDEMFQSAQSIAGSYEERVHSRAFNGWETIMASADEIMGHREIFDWGLNQRLLNIVEAYLGLPVAYDGLNMFYTVADGKQVATRKWHRDREDRRMIKIAVYCNDVDEGGGPLQIVRRNVLKGEMADGFTYPVLSQEALENELGGPMNDRDVVTCTGLKGTVIFTDTASQYHRGKPAVTKDRCAIFYNYFSRVPRHPFFCERSGLSRAQIAELAQSLTPEQRDCVLWRENLPAIARMVPPNIA
jgi:hypothetical protein